MYLVLIVLFIVGIVVSLSSDSYFCMWVGLELSAVCIIPWIKSDDCEAIYSVMFKYFVIQSVCSIMLHFGLVVIWGFLGLFYGVVLGILALMVNLGGVFVGYILSLVESMTWSSFIVVIGVQKLPLFVLLVNVADSLGVVLTVITGVLVGIFSVWSSVVLSVRGFIVLSSVLNISWIICGIAVCCISGVLYFIVYLGTFVCVCALFYSQNVMDYSSTCYNEGNITVVESTMLLVMSGLPPFALFFSNVDIILEIVSGNFLLECWFLVIFSAFLMYVYVNLAVCNLFLGNSYWMNEFSSNKWESGVFLVCVIWCLVWTIF